MHLRWQALEQKGEGSVKWFGINHVIVVKDENKIVGDGSDFIEQQCKKRFDWRRLRLRSVERAQHPFANGRDNRLQSSDEVRQKACGITISFVQRQPGSL